MLSPGSWERLSNQCNPVCFLYHLDFSQVPKHLSLLNLHFLCSQRHLSLAENRRSVSISYYTEVHDYRSSLSFTDLESSRRDERAGEISFLLQALLAALWLTLVYKGPRASDFVELYRYVIVLGRRMRWWNWFHSTCSSCRPGSRRIPAHQALQIWNRLDVTNALVKSAPSLEPSSRFYG